MVVGRKRVNARKWLICGRWLEVFQALNRQYFEKLLVTINNFAIFASFVNNQGYG